MQDQLTALIAYTNIMKHAEKIKNDQEHDLRSSMEVNDAWAQGDLLIRKIPSIPEDVELCEFERQLAPGNTQGSRHCLRSETGVKLFRLLGPNALEGPIFELQCDNAVDHPEHGNVLLGPGIYAIEHQRALADELRRVRD